MTTTDAMGECALVASDDPLPTPLPVAPVPLSPSLVLLICAVATLAAVGWKRRKS